CGALYDGTSPDGTCYEPDSIQKVHQSYGRPYQLPNSTAHNETCANIGNMLFNWRMLESTGDARYADIVETALYNSVLSGVSLDGKRYFYTNPLRMSDNLPYTLRWPKTREEYISCFCCPPNTLRTICEAQNYAYTVNDSTLWCNLYGDSELRTSLGKKRPLAVTQHTGYPYDGKVVLKFVETPKKEDITLNLRVPSWCDKATVSVNGKPEAVSVTPDSYISLRRVWKPGDEVVFDMDMRTRLLESNPLVEETRNHVAVKRGPIVYCLESIDIEDGKSIDDVLIPADAAFTETDITIDGSRMTALETMARLADNGDWTGKLYREVGSADKSVRVTLIPYYAWGNRDKAEMSVWLPLSR
ncbi:glycoside hydrolase family 127 protein, partial [uncultured Duncaniella sp.]|uniref:glycoside hydrolase family 127 protein n=1 Tax=uncultured Duncaniella sp. TaxID=2768039 RepID=UPI00272C97FB